MDVYVSGKVILSTDDRELAVVTALCSLERADVVDWYSGEVLFQAERGAMTYCCPDWDVEEEDV
jgi:hypothetical protein